MDNGRRKALLWMLLHRDLSDVDICDVPQTAVLAVQKALSRRGMIGWSRSLRLTACCHARMPRGNNIAITTGEGQGKGLYAEAKIMVPELKFVSGIIISKTLQKDSGCKPWHSGGRRGLIFS